MFLALDKTPGVFGHAGSSAHGPEASGGQKHAQKCSLWGLSEPDQKYMFQNCISFPLEHLENTFWAVEVVFILPFELCIIVSVALHVAIWFYARRRGSSGLPIHQTQCGFQLLYSVTWFLACRRGSSGLPTHQTQLSYQI